MFDIYLRKFKDRIGEPLAYRLEKIDPKMITIFGLGFGLASAILAYFSLFVWALIFWLINRSLDGLDGLVARLHDKQDDLGGYLDTMVDWIVYAALPFGLVLAEPNAIRYLALAILLASFYINTAALMYLSIILEKKPFQKQDNQTTIIMPPGLVGGTETILFYCLILLFPGRIVLLFSIFAGLVSITIIQRISWAVRNLSPSQRKGRNNENQFSSSKILPVQHAATKDIPE